MTSWRLVRRIPDELLDDLMSVLVVSESSAGCVGLVSAVERGSLSFLGELLEDRGLPSSSFSSDTDVTGGKEALIDEMVFEAIEGTGSKKLLSSTRQGKIFVFDEMNHHGLMIRK